jgi:LPS O-antigen subunit length determinant protein (WzzB/FepE family)
MTTSGLNMRHTIQVLQKHTRFILLFTLFAMLVAFVTVLLVPKYFRSGARIIAANPQLTDKSRLFNENIQGLYSYFGSGDDLDRIIGVADMDTTYYQLVDQFNLIRYYGLDDDSLPLLRRKAVLKLKKDISFQRTEQGQMRIVCWTKDRQLSADIINAMIAIVQQKLASIWLSNYQTATVQLNASITHNEQQYASLNDSISKASPTQQILLQKHMETLLEELSRYRKTAASFQLMGETVPPALYILEPAVPSAKAERPDKLNIVLISGLAGFLFSILFLLLKDRRY